MASPEALAIQAARREEARAEQLRRIDERLARIEAKLGTEPEPPAPAADPEAATAAHRAAMTPKPKGK